MTDVIFLEGLGREGNRQRAAGSGVGNFATLEGFQYRNRNRYQALYQLEGIRVLEVPAQIPAIDSGGKSRRNHVPLNSTYDQFCDQY